VETPYKSLGSCDREQACSTEELMSVLGSWQCVSVLRFVETELVDLRYNIEASVK
jgi:hypothetical protein